MSPFRPSFPLQFDVYPKEPRRLASLPTTHYHLSFPFSLCALCLCGKSILFIRLRPRRLPSLSTTHHLSFPFSLCALCLCGKSILFIRLQPLGRPQKSQLLCSQANPASFCKTPGVWGTSAEPPRSLRLSVILCPCFCRPAPGRGSEFRSPLATRHSPLSCIYLWNQHLQKCIKTKDFKCH